VPGIRRLQWQLLAGGAAALALASAGAPAPAATPSKSAVHTVTIEEMQYRPSSLAVAVGDRIVWVNHDPFPHTVTSQAGRFDSREIAAGRSWTYTVTRAGVFSYGCAFHPSMSAVVRADER
jgi:plastocyanin